MTKRLFQLASLVCLCLLSVAGAQQQYDQTGPLQASVAGRPVPFAYRTIQAVDYRSGKSTEVNFRGTDLMPAARGEANVASKSGRIAIHAKFEHIQPPSNFGLAYTTYVLWCISPEGRASNLGEVLLNGEGNSEVKATTSLQAFGMIVTGEPYFAVTEPSELIVLENQVQPRTKGAVEPIIARYQVLPRGLYLGTNEPIRESVYGIDKDAPRDLIQARNALRIARNAEAERYAADTLYKAQKLLDQAEDYYKRKQNKTAISTVARQAAQTAEEARVMALRRSEEERVAEQRRAAERQAADAQQEAAMAQRRAQQAQSEAMAEAQQRQQTEAELEGARRAREEVERQKLEAQAATQQAQQIQQQAEASRQAALEQQQALAAQAEQARLAAQQAQQAAATAEREKEETRGRLLAQLNQVLETKDTAQGLIVNMPDVLFDTGKATLKPSARERLAKVAGIILAYPDLHLKVEGFTDSVGSEEYNLTLSEHRAAAVRDYLISQGVPVNNVVAQGFGKANPVASNATAQGRQLNRRVDLLVTGGAIGSQIGAAPSGATATTGGTAGTATGVGTALQPTQNNPGNMSAPSQPPKR